MEENIKVNVVAVSSRGRSRIGINPVPAVIEQSFRDKVFIVMNDRNQCRWIKRENDPDFQIILMPEE